MIKEIKVPIYPEIEKSIQTLPPAKQEQYERLKEAYEKETAKPNPNHELIASIMAQANKLLK